MKKNILFISMIILLFVTIPFIVNAETCDNNKLSISSITIDKQTGDVVELADPIVNGKDININLSMSEVGDSVKYKVVVKNESNEDYELDKNSFNISSDYIDYKIEFEDNSNII